MRFMKTALALAALGIAGAASAGSNTGNMTVTATTTNACYINGGTIDFGNFPAYAHTNIDVAGNIVLECSANTPYQIYRQSQPTMTGPAALSFNVYPDASRAVALGTAPGAGAISGDSGTGGVINVPLYARINQGTNTAAGAYTGNVPFTVSF